MQPPPSIQADDSLAPTADESFGQFYKRVNCAVADSIYQNTFGRVGDTESMYSDANFAHPSYSDGVYESTVFMYDFDLSISYYSSIRVQLSQSNRALVDQALIDGDIATAITYLSHISKGITLDTKDVITLNPTLARDLTNDIADLVGTEAAQQLGHPYRDTIYRDGQFYVLCADQHYEYLVPADVDFTFDDNGVVIGFDNIQSRLGDTITVENDSLNSIILSHYETQYNNKLADNELGS